jgi:nucleotide-binding universal stress UspA family protein
MKTFSPKTILAPVDFSLRSGHAARYATALAARFDSDLILLHVLEPLGLVFSMVEPNRSLFQNVLEVRRSAAQAELERFAPEWSDIRIIAEGDAAEQILCTASRQDADLIVMPTQGRSRIRRFIVGSVTAKVLHDSPIPVWTGVHLDYEQNFPELHIRHILCAVDFGRQSTTVLEAGADLTAAFNATASAVHIISDAGAALSNNQTCCKRWTGSECSCAPRGSKPAVTSSAAIRTKLCQRRLASLRRISSSSGVAARTISRAGCARRHTASFVRPRVRC